MAQTNESSKQWSAPQVAGSSSDKAVARHATNSTNVSYDSRVVSCSTGPSEQPVTVPNPPSRSASQDRAPDALDVARYLIYLAAVEPEPEYLTHMRLQKLLYYVQGWSLALKKRPMFSDRIEAWAHGPVVRSVYPQFADFGDQPIPPQKLLISDRLSDEDREFIESVWEAYKGYSSSSLRAMTHKEAPWRETRGQCAPADRCTAEITQDALKRFFTRASKRHGSEEE